MRDVADVVIVIAFFQLRKKKIKRRKVKKKVNGLGLTQKITTKHYKAKGPVLARANV